MKLKQEHISMLGVGVTAIGVIAMIVYYKHAQAAADSSSSSGGMGAFPYFTTAAIPSSVTGPAAGGVANTTPIDLNSLAGTQAALQGHISDNALQSNWASVLQTNVSDLIGNLGSQGYAAGAFNAQLVQGPGGGFNYNFSTAVLPGHAPNATASVPAPTIIGASVYTPAPSYDFSSNAGNPGGGSAGSGDSAGAAAGAGGAGSGAAGDM